MTYKTKAMCDVGNVWYCPAQMTSFGVEPSSSRDSWSRTTRNRRMDMDGKVW